MNQFFLRKTLGLLFILAIIFNISCSGGEDTGGILTGSGTGGSMAKFNISGDYLYIVLTNKLVTFDISDPKNPIKTLSGFEIGSIIETIYSYGGNLFLGTPQGMIIYDITTNPSQPELISYYDHITSCDPVVVSGKYAYITLRSGSTCNRGVNVLEILDVDTLSNPKFISSMPMINPHGLGLNDTLLFVAEGNFGLKVFDRSIPDSLVLISSIEDFNAYDVIVNGKVLIVTGSDGVYQYDFSDPSNLKLLSTL